MSDAQKAELQKLTSELVKEQRHRRETIAAFEANLKEAYSKGFDEGLAQGRSYQAIIEVRGREKFIDSLDALCGKCKKKIAKIKQTECG